MQSALTDTIADAKNVTLSTGDDSIIIVGGAGQEITTKLNDEESTLLFLTEAPTNASVNGSDLVVTAGSKDYTFTGAAADTVTLTIGENTYTAEATRITDITDADAKKVTLTTDFTDTSYGLQKDYSMGVTAVDATNAAGTKLVLTASKSTADVSLVGAPNVKNSLIGGTGNDTLIGGDKNDRYRGGKGADLFVQSGGKDSITDYTGGEDVISLQSALTDTIADDKNVTLSTGDDSIIIVGGAGQAITTKLNDEESTLSFLTEAPTNSSVNGSDLVVTAGSKDYTFAGAAADTVTLTIGENTYTADATRITDITDAEAKAVTLTTGFTNTYYGLHQSYGKGVTAVDATNADTTELNLAAFRSTEDLVLKGASNATNAITSGAGNDTITGGDKNDVLKGNAGTDLFVQSGGTDTISDYTSGEDVISLQSALTNVKANASNVTLSTGDDSIIIVGGTGQVITTKLNDEEITLLFLPSVPTNASVNGSDLVVTAGSKDYTFTGAAADTVTVMVGENIYTAEATRITDITNADAKAVTLTTDFTDTSYGLERDYSAGVTAVDATNANSTKLVLTASKSTADVSLVGAPNVKNSLIGGAGNDTITGGDKNDVLKGNAGTDLFVQSGGTDTISDYTSGEDVISLQSALTSTEADSSNVTLGTAEGSIVVADGSGKIIKTRLDGEDTRLLLMADVPTNSSVNGSDLVVTAGGKDYTFANAAEETLKVTVGSDLYGVDATRITNLNNADAKSVTLTTGFTNTYYGLHQSYGTGVTAVDATNADTTELNLAAFRSTENLVLKGASNATNAITGGAGNDTITGGDKNDVLKGNAGADLFVQSGGTDTISDYSAEDTIQFLTSSTSRKVDGRDIVFTNSYGTIRVSLGGGKTITTVVGGSNALASTNDELWGVSGEKDTFLFDGGKDTIHNYEEDDVISLADHSLSDLVSGSPSVSDKNLIFTFDKSNALTVSDVAGSGTPITFDDGTTYIYNGKTYSKK